MGLTRKGCKAMGLTEEQIDFIMDGHAETVDGLKEKLKAAEENAGKLDGVQKELDALKANGGDDYEAKFEKATKDLEDFKKTVAAEKEQAARERAARAYFESKNITGTNLDIAMRAAEREIAALELDGDKIKDASTLDALTSGTLAGLVKTTAVVGAHVATPPAGTAAKMTKADIYKKDDKGRYVYSTEQRQRYLAENPEIMNS